MFPCNGLCMLVECCCVVISTMVVPVVWMRPDRMRQAQQGCLPGLSQPPAESPRLLHAAHISWLPQECCQHSNNQHRNSGWCCLRVSKEARISTPKPKLAGRETGGEGAAYQAEDVQTALQVLVGSWQVGVTGQSGTGCRCHGLLNWTGSDHFPLHPTTLLGSPSFNFLLIHWV